jgi:hypothetical protein
LKTEKKIDSSAMTTRVGQAPKKVFKGVGKPNGKTHSGTNRQDIKKGLHDYNYYLGSARKASDYEMTTEYIINYIKKHLTMEVTLPNHSRNFKMWIQVCGSQHNSKVMTVMIQLRLQQ